MYLKNNIKMWEVYIQKISNEGEDYHLDNLCIKFSNCDKYSGSAQECSKA